MGGQTTFADFLHSTTMTGKQPAGLSPALQALWLDRVEKWDEAHELAQAAGGPDGAWVHAYLHRKEGDKENAAYWYRLAGKPAARGTLPDEWEQIVRAMLGGE
jgi:hypothetical protein